MAPPSDFHGKVRRGPSWLDKPQALTVVRSLLSGAAHRLGARTGLARAFEGGDVPSVNYSRGLR